MMLWLQEPVAPKHLRVVKVATESNPADMLTKALGKSKMEEFCEEIIKTTSQKTRFRSVNNYKEFTYR